jgi:hypothetical protein
VNLRLVHAFLILLSAALAVVFGIWCLGQYGGPGDGGRSTPASQGYIVAAVVAFVVSAGLIAYDSWFLRKTRALR